MYVVFIVHRLRPGDIDVVAALGDSATVSSAKLYFLSVRPFVSPFPVLGLS